MAELALSILLHSLVHRSLSYRERVGSSATEHSAVAEGSCWQCASGAPSGRASLVIRLAMIYAIHRVVSQQQIAVEEKSREIRCMTVARNSQIIRRRDDEVERGSEMIVAASHGPMLAATCCRLQPCRAASRGCISDKRDAARATGAIAKRVPHLRLCLL